ncbi:hypothetical protein Tco_0639462 [Tanacetum coccineum]
MSVRAQTPISLPSDAEVVRLLAIPTPPLVQILNKRTKMKPIRTKPSAGMERARKTEAEVIFMFNGPTRTRLMGRVSPLTLESY